MKLKNSAFKIFLKGKFTSRFPTCLRLHGAHQTLSDSTSSPFVGNNVESKENNKYDAFHCDYWWVVSLVCVSKSPSWLMYWYFALLSDDHPPSIITNVPAGSAENVWNFNFLPVNTVILCHFWCRWVIRVFTNLECRWISSSS